MCSRVCPQLANECEAHNNTLAFVLRHKDDDIVDDSTSGGAFSAIVEAFTCESSNYSIYGSALDDNMMAKHIRITDSSNLNQLRKSKYVESYIGKIYRDVKLDLEKGKKVLFSGTPCQCAGLRAYLRKDYSELITVEIICHGVPTQLLLKKYIEYRERKAKGKCTDIQFRSKFNSNWLNPKIRITFNNGRIYEQKSYADDDEYMIGFCKFLSIRKNCEHCLYASPDRYSDFTIGDFWGIESSNIKMDYKDGISLILINSERAQRYLSGIRDHAELTEIDYKFAQKHNAQLVCPSEHHPMRDQFLNDLSTETFEGLRKKYLKPRNKIINIMSNVLSRETKAKIKRMLGLKPTKY